MKQVTTQKIIKSSKPPVQITEEGDTTNYIIGFPDNRELKAFKRKLKKLTEEYSFDTLANDTINQYLCLRIIQTKETPIDSDTAITHIERADFIESDITIREDTLRDTTGQYIDSLLPEVGGNATLYTERSFIDPRMSALFVTFPFEKDTTLYPDDSAYQGLLQVRQLTRTKIEIVCTDRLLNSVGKAINALDLVKAWTELVKINPAEGKALFYYTKGLRPFIRGEEAIIQGFTIVNQQTVHITLEKPDPQAIQRLYSTRLLPLSLNVGAYVKKQKNNQKLALTRNTQRQKPPTFLEQCVITCGGDKNPIVSFSLNKYDMALLYSRKDLDYARRSLTDKANLVPFSREKYFISLATPSQEIRAYLSTLINPEEVLKNAVKAEGTLLQALEENLVEQISTTDPQKKQRPSTIDKIAIVYLETDPISVAIAEKIFSLFTNAGVSVNLSALSTTELEKALVSRSYDCAIGWVPETISTDLTEQLRCAAIWFRGETDETIRLRENLELPLFTIDTYALYKKHLGFFQNTLTGIYLVKENKQ